jgi:hypothetical protein
MQTHNKKIWAALLGALLVAAGLFFGPGLMEKNTASRVSEFLQSLPGDVRAKSVKADFWNAEVILQGITGTGKRLDGGNFTFEIGEILAGDIKSGSLTASGPVPLLGRFLAKDVNIRVDVVLPASTQPVTQAIHIADLSLQDISGDLKRLMQSGNAGQAEFLDALATCRVGNVAVNGYVVDSGLGSLGTVRIVQDSLTVRDMTMQGTGPMELRGFKCSILGMDIVSMAGMRTASVSGPNMYRYATLIQEAQDESTAISLLTQALKTTPIVIRRMECEDISLPLNFPADKRLRIAGTSTDVTLDARGFKVSAAVSGLSIPPDLLSLLVPLASEFATAYGKNLQIEAVADVDGTLEEKAGTLSVNTLSLTDPALVSLAASGAFAFTVKEGREGGLEGLLLSGAEMFLKNCRLMIEDINLIGTVLAGSGDKDAARSATAALLQSQAEAENSELWIKTLRGLALLVAAPGKLTVDVNPALPLPLSSDFPGEEAMRSLDAGTTVEYIRR